MLSCQYLVKNPSVFNFLLKCPFILKYHNKVSLKPPLLQTEHPQLSQLSSDHFCGPTLSPCFSCTADPRLGCREGLMRVEQTNINILWKHSDCQIWSCLLCLYQAMFSTSMWMEPAGTQTRNSFRFIGVHLSYTCKKCIPIWFNLFFPLFWS